MKEGQELGGNGVDVGDVLPGGVTATAIAARAQGPTYTAGDVVWVEDGRGGLGEDALAHEGGGYGRSDVGAADVACALIAEGKEVLSLPLYSRGRKTGPPTNPRTG